MDQFTLNRKDIFPRKNDPSLNYIPIFDQSTTFLLGRVPLVGPISLGQIFQACGMKACDGQSMGMVHPCGAMAPPATLRAVSESSVGTELKWPFCDRCDRCGRSVSSYNVFSLIKNDKKNKRRRYWHLKVFCFFFKLDIDLESYDFVKRIHPPRKKHGTFSFVVGRRKSPKEKNQNIVSFPRHCPMRDAGENLWEH